MKKKMFVFLCVAVALFFGSCADLSVNDEEAVKADLPSDFDWEVYAEINNDVKMSQIIFDVREKNKEYGKGADSASKALGNCTDILKDENKGEDFAKKLYLEYMKCPEQGWTLDEKCSGIYANNGSYSKPTINEQDTTWQCLIDGCWNGGWNESTVDNNLQAMCKFIPPKDLAGAQNYLETFEYNSYLIEQHYHFFGRNDGRPYKYCDAVHGEEKTHNLPLVVRRGSSTDYANYYYDYGRYTFCLDKNDQKIYVVQ